MVISLVEREQFWHKLVYDIKNADERAESGILGVIWEATIGNHEVTEKKVIEDSIKKNHQNNHRNQTSPPFKKLGKISLYFSVNFKNKYF